MDQFLLSPHNWDMILRLLLATVLGGAVGIERGSGDRPAGFRTHILVCTGSALIMLVSMYGFDDTYVSGISNANNQGLCTYCGAGSKRHWLFGCRHDYA